MTAVNRSMYLGASMNFGVPRWAALWLWLALIMLPGAAHAQAERVTGDWQQFVLVNDVWRLLGTYRVEKAGDQYRMAPVNQAKGPDVINSQGLSDVGFSGEDWTFRSDWGKEGVAQFRLRRTAQGVYLGWSYLREERRNFNIWVLVR
jgi:hypothetical protein